MDEPHVGDVAVGHPEVGELPEVLADDEPAVRVVGLAVEAEGLVRHDDLLRLRRPVRASAVEARLLVLVVEGRPEGFTLVQVGLFEVGAGVAEAYPRSAARTAGEVGGLAGGGLQAPDVVAVVEEETLVVLAAVRGRAGRPRRVRRRRGCGSAGVSSPGTPVRGTAVHLGQGCGRSRPAASSCRSGAPKGAETRRGAPRRDSYGPKTDPSISLL